MWYTCWGHILLLYVAYRQTLVCSIDVRIPLEPQLPGRMRAFKQSPLRNDGLVREGTESSYGNLAAVDTNSCQVSRHLKVSAAHLSIKSQSCREFTKQPANQPSNSQYVGAAYTQDSTLYNFVITKKKELNNNNVSRSPVTLLKFVNARAECEAIYPTRWKSQCEMFAFLRVSTRSQCNETLHN